MKSILNLTYTLVQLISFSSAFAQTAPTQGFTCERAANAYSSGISSVETISPDSDGNTSFVHASEVYCTPGFWAFAKDNSVSVLNFASEDAIDPITDQDVTDVRVNFSCSSSAVQFSQGGVASFDKKVLAGRWSYIHYQCKTVKSNVDALICKLNFGGYQDFGYAIFTLSGSTNGLPPGILE